MGEPNLSRATDCRSLTVEGFILCPTGIVCPDDATYESWERVGLYLGYLEAAVQWWIADWVAKGQARWGEMYSQAEAATGLSQQTLRDCKYVSEKFDLSRRRDKLPFAHHREVAALDVADQERLLDLAEPAIDDPTGTPRMTRAQLRACVSAIRNVKPTFIRADEEGKIQSWLEAQREGWPEKERPWFIKSLETIVDRLAGEA